MTSMPTARLIERRIVHKLSIIVSPYTREAKVYPYWQELITMLSKKYKVIQLGVSGEKMFYDAVGVFDRTLPDVEKELSDVGYFVCSDNFLHHLAYVLGVKGVVIFGPSDPDIFGQPTNVNLLKSREFLRKDQFAYYGDYKWEHKDKGWMSPEQVYKEALDGDGRYERDNAKVRDRRLQG